MKALTLVLGIFLMIYSNLSVGASAWNSSPCRHISLACEAAGYSKNNIMQNCLRPILTGHSVKGVNMDFRYISACREKISYMEGE